MMKFDIITLFPDMFTGPFSESIICRAQKKGLIEIKIHQLRDSATDKHKTVDDTPYGGGPGMVLRVDIVDKAIRNVIYCSSKARTKNDNSSRPQTASNNKSRTIMLSPRGEKFIQQKAIELSKYDNIILLCGHYEGFDQRVHDHLVDEEISIGDYVLTGGELPAMVIVDAISRMVPGVIKKESIESESFMPSSVIARSDLGTKQSNPNKLIPNSYNLNYDYPVYTRPLEYKGWKVPEVLTNGNHKEIKKWRENRRH